jgi:predicted deacylase
MGFFFILNRLCISATLDTVLNSYKQKLKKVPFSLRIVTGASFIVFVAVGLLLFIPKQVAFTYAGETCVPQLVLFPQVQQSRSDRFEITPKNELKIGAFSYAATSVCVAATEQPEPGKERASIGLFGGWFMPKLFTITVPEAPVARTESLIGGAISPVLPVKVPLSATDTLFSYTLRIANKSTDCKAADTTLQCDISTLNLEPDTLYDVSLTRRFNAASEEQLAAGSVKTLLPVHLIESSVPDGTTIYDTRKDLQLTFDMPMQSGEVSLKLESDQARSIPVTLRANNQTLIVTSDTDLPRKSQFTLTVHQAIATNGSALETPLVTRFTTSGGPKPKSVSVGATGVSQTAQIIVTLDQPIRDGTDLAKVARVEGVPGSVAKRSSTELVYSIQAGLCRSFSLVLDKGVASGSNDEVSDAWKFDARTICGTTSVIGYSVQGRPLIAYYFGSGSKTILFTGGIHGEERSAQQTMQAWADYLMTNAYKLPENTRVVIVPNLNPDGIAKGSRNNANNVNLGRNYPTANWRASIDTASGILPTGGGTEPGSEPETKAIMALTRQLMPRLEISFHAQGRLVGANKVADSVAIGATYAATVGYDTMFTNAEEVMGYSITGEYEEWMGEQFGIPAILIELPSRSGNYLTSQLPALLKLLAL